jgi:hypothetical protein
MSAFYSVHPNGNRFYDIYELMPKLGFDLENEDDMFNEMSGPWGAARRFDVYQFKHPIIPANIPERFDFYSFPEVMQYPIVMPTIAGLGNAGEVVSFAFIDAMRELGFHDFVTYPVRVHLVNNSEQFESNLELIAGNFPYRDDLFVMLQLTAPHLSLLEPIPVGKPVDPKRYRMDDNYYLREDFENINCPFFFRIENAHFDLRCNELAAKALSAPEFYGIRLIGRERKKIF